MDHREFIMKEGLLCRAFEPAFISFVEATLEEKVCIDGESSGSD